MCDLNDLTLDPSDGKDENISFFTFEHSLHKNYTLPTNMRGGI